MVILVSDQDLLCAEDVFIGAVLFRPPSYHECLHGIYYGINFKHILLYIKYLCTECIAVSILITFFYISPMHVCTTKIKH